MLTFIPVPIYDGRKLKTVVLNEDTVDFSAFPAYKGELTVNSLVIVEYIASAYPTHGVYKLSSNILSILVLVDG